jgi:hypothetical protein
MMKRIVFSVVLFVIAMISMRVVYNRFTPPSIACLTTVLPFCSVEEQTVTLTTQVFEHGITLRLSFPSRLHVLRYYSEQRGYGYMVSSSSTWSDGPLSQTANPYGSELTQRNLESLWQNRMRSLGLATEDAITYTTTLEITGGTTLYPSDSVTYMRLPDGRGIGFDENSGHWHFVDETQ